MRPIDETVDLRAGPDVSIPGRRPSALESSLCSGRGASVETGSDDIIVKRLIGSDNGSSEGSLKGLVRS